MMKIFIVKKKTFADEQQLDENASQLRQKTLENLKEQLKKAEDDLSRVQERQRRQEEILKSKNSREIESYQNRVQGIKRSIDALYK